MENPGLNIWAADKDISIKHLLLLLTESFAPGSFDIIVSEEDAPRAVRLKNPASPRTQLYIFTYGQEEGRYGVHIEFPNLQETNYSDTLEILENVSYESLVNIMINNLDLPLK
jgi:hypothetical protein